jgi:SPP1 family predicted phage head-tail adaptor
VQRDPTTGESRTTWSKLLRNVPAAIEPLSTREYIASQAKDSEVTTRITVRYHPGLKAAQRIVHKTAAGVRIYNPLGVLPDRDSLLEYITLPCSEGVSDDGS